MGDSPRPDQLPLEECDTLVLGAGVSGGRAALELAGHGSLVLMAKEEKGTASEAAQGGIAAALGDHDSLQSHAQDTIACGRGLCDEAVVGLTVREGLERVRELIAWGCPFDKDSNGKLLLVREGGHSQPRVLHASGDRTGQAIVATLALRARDLGVKLARVETAVSLVKEGDRCSGALILFKAGDLRYVRAKKAVILGTGGLGALYSRHTNPPSATGDGLAMAMRSGARCSDLEFIQFHPTAYFAPGSPAFLISEAVRGEGAELRNARGENFMPRYSSEADLAPRDVTARAIMTEEREGRGPVVLDISSISQSFENRFPSISQWLAKNHVDLRLGIPVSPGAHFSMGGVATDIEGRSSIPGLFAAGEVASTGLHGANRMGSNSLLEGLVFGRRAGLAALEGPGLPSGGHALSSDFGLEDPAFRSDLGVQAWKDLGLFRRREGLQDFLHFLESRPRVSHKMGRESVEAGNLAYVAGKVAYSALQREESRGAHFREDFPESKQAWGSQHLVWEGGRLFEGLNALRETPLTPILKGS